METHKYKSLDCITVADISALGIPIEVADLIHGKLAGIIRDCGAGTPQTWQMICKQVLSPELPFSFHQMMYYGCYKEFGPDPFAWIPDSYVVLFYFKCFII